MNETSAHIIGKAAAFQKVRPATGRSEHRPRTMHSVVNDKPIFYEDTPTHTHTQTHMLKRKVITSGVRVCRHLQSLEEKMNFKLKCPFDALS